jgi:hypothetical protein
MKEIWFLVSFDALLLLFLADRSGVYFVGGSQFVLLRRFLILCLFFGLWLLPKSFHILGDLIFRLGFYYWHSTFLWIGYCCIGFHLLNIHEFSLRVVLSMSFL